MFRGNLLHAQRCAQLSHHIRYLGEHDVCLGWLLKKPLYQPTKCLLHFYNPARQPSLTEASSFNHKCDQERMSTALQPKAQAPLLDPIVLQGARQPTEFLPQQLDAFQLKISEAGTLRSEAGETQCIELPFGTAKKAGSSLYEKCLVHKEGKKLVLRRLRERVTGSWAHDWRIPLELLKENHPDQEVERAKEIEHLPWNNRSGFQKRIRQRRADEIERPREWNAVTFKNFVDDLTTSSVDRLMQRQLYGGKTTHVEAVAKVLEELFDDVGRKEVITPGACNAAMEFFAKHSMISKARAIFNQMENLLINIEPETVDIILRRTAARNDLHNYTFILRAMLRRGFEPNGRTWVALLMAVDSSEVRKVIIQEMRTRGLLEDLLILKEAVVLVIRDEWSTSLGSGLDTASFLAAMDSRYGSQWLSVSACNNLLHEFGRTKDMREVMDLVDVLIDRGLIPNEVTFNTLVTLCSLQNQHDAIIGLLRRFRHLSPSKIAYASLFRLVWNRRMYNCAKVIWGSACMDAMTSFQMQALVHRSLLESILGGSRNGPQSRGEIWKASAGAVVVGIRPSKQLERVFAQPARVAGSSTPEAGTPESKTKTRRMIAALIRDDLATAGRFRPVRDLADLLREALARDREWQQARALQVQAAAWKRENAVDIEVEPALPSSSTMWRYCTVLTRNDEKSEAG
jgi:hypothetical protein